MQSMKFIGQVLVMFLVAVLSAYAVPPVLNYAGQVAVNGQPFEGDGLFKFALVNSDGKVTYWSNDGTSVNGSEPQASVKASVRGGLYSLLLGNTAIPGMGAINPLVFVQHSDAKLRVWFSDGVNGFQQLSPDRPFASVPYAFSAGTATIADGSINKSMLGSDVIADLNKTVTITRDMLPQDVRDDLNKTVTITRSMLPVDVLADLNRTVSKSMLANDVLSDLNSTIGINRLSAEVTDKLDQNGSGGAGVVSGSLISIRYGQPAPAGYSLYQRGEPKALVWEEKAPVSVARYAFDGVEVLDDKIYFVGGSIGGTASTSFDLVEIYDPENDIWQTSTPMDDAINYLASSVINNYLFVIGGYISGNESNKVTLLDNDTQAWTTKNNLPLSVRASSAITHLGSMYLVGGYSAGNQINKVYKYEMTSDTWVQKASLLEARDLHKLVSFNGRIWAIGGWKGGGITNTVESYDPLRDSWQTEKPLNTNRNAPITWVANGKIYVGGGTNGSNIVYQSIEVYDPTTKHWTISGNLPENISFADSVVLNDHVYVVAGKRNLSTFSNKVYAADLNASVAGVYDLYRKDGNASAGTPVVQAEVADGSVTASKIANKTIGKDQISDEILKYLKPEVTAQPQAQTVYADSNVSFSVTAEGKYLSYQWKKDGVDLTGETNASLNITDANVSVHDGNYSVVVSNDFGSVESNVTTFIVVNDINAISGLVGWWKFDETNGTSANDSSGYERHAKMLGFDSNQSYWTSGKIGGSLTFDGVNDYAEVQGFYGINGKNPRTISAWIKTDSNNSNIMGWGRSNAGREWKLSISDGNFRTSVWSGWVYGSNAAYANDWVHIASILPSEASVSSQIIHYFNGNLEILEIQEFSIITGEDYTVKIGTNMNAGGKMYGAIDDLRLYDRALSAAEVQALYNLGQ